MLPTIPPIPAGEGAFEAIADYFVVAVVAAGSSDALLRQAIATSIRRYYDALEAAGKPRGAAELFFLAEGTTKGVPIDRARKRISDDVANQIFAMWEAVQTSVK